MMHATTREREASSPERLIDHESERLVIGGQHPR